MSRCVCAHECVCESISTFNASFEQMISDVMEICSGRPMPDKALKHIYLQAIPPTVRERVSTTGFRNEIACRDATLCADGVLCVLAHHIRSQSMPRQCPLECIHICYPIPLLLRLNEGASRRLPQTRIKDAHRCILASAFTCLSVAFTCQAIYARMCIIWMSTYRCMCIHTSILIWVFISTFCRLLYLSLTTRQRGLGTLINWR